MVKLEKKLSADTLRQFIAKTIDAEGALKKDSISCPDGQIPYIMTKSKFTKERVDKASGTVIPPRVQYEAGDVFCRNPPKEKAKKRMPCPESVKSALEVELTVPYTKTDGTSATANLKQRCYVKKIKPPRNSEAYKEYHVRNKNSTFITPSVPAEVRLAEAKKRINMGSKAEVFKKGKDTGVIRFEPLKNEVGGIMDDGKGNAFAIVVRGLSAKQKAGVKKFFDFKNSDYGLFIRDDVNAVFRKLYKEFKNSASNKDLYERAKKKDQDAIKALRKQRGALKREALLQAIASSGKFTDKVALGKKNKAVKLLKAKYGGRLASVPKIAKDDYDKMLTSIKKYRENKKRMVEI